MRLATTLIIILCLSITLVACSSGAGRSPYDTNYRTGSQALEIRFQQNQHQVFEGDTLAIIVEIFNRGTHDITNGQLFLMGYDPAYFNFRFDPTSRLNIEGKSQFDPTGELSQTFVIQDQRVSMPRNRDRFEQQLQLVACYEYATTASIPVCIDPDPTNSRIGDKVCQGRTVSPSPQGHPVAVVSVEPRTSRNDIRFNIQIRNVGNGQVYDNRISLEKCAFDLGYTDVDKFYVGRVSLSDRALDCTQINPVRLRTDGTALLACTCRNCINELDNAYQANLNVELRYGYRNSRTTAITVFSDQ